MGDMGERAAKRILQVGGFDESDQTMAFARLYARAVIYTMREPTIEMLSAAEDLKAVSKGVEISPSPYDAWQAMIDAALSSEQEK